MKGLLKLRDGQNIYFLCRTNSINVVVFKDEKLVDVKDYPNYVRTYIKRKIDLIPIVKDFVVGGDVTEQNKTVETKTDEGGVDTTQDDDKIDGELAQTQGNIDSGETVDTNESDDTSGNDESTEKLEVKDPQENEKAASKPKKIDAAKDRILSLAAQIERITGKAVKVDLGEIKSNKAANAKIEEMTKYLDSLDLEQSQQE